jgi:uncharacterized protein (TIGR02246 family)
MIKEVQAISADLAAQTDHSIFTAVAEASRRWKEAFNSGNAEAAANLYEDDAVMVVKPFGKFTGREEILAFWTNLVAQGFKDVLYVDTKAEIINDKSARLSAQWKMNKAHGVITNETWVIQPDGRALLREDHFEVAE